MSRPTAPSAGALLPDPPALALRAPSRGRTGPQQGPTPRPFGALRSTSQPGTPRPHVPPQAAGRSPAISQPNRASRGSAADLGQSAPRPCPNTGGRGWQVVTTAVASPGSAASVAAGNPDNVTSSPAASPPSFPGARAPAPGPSMMPRGLWFPAAGPGGAGGAAASMRRSRNIAVGAAASSAGAGRHFGQHGYHYGHHYQPPGLYHHGLGPYPNPHPHLHAHAHAYPHGPHGLHHHVHHHVGLGRSLHPARGQWAAEARTRLQAVKSSGAAPAGGLSGSVQVGALVEIEKNGRDVLALVAGPDGKKNWFVVDTTGRRQSITPKQVQLVLPGGGYTEADVAAFAAAAEGADTSLLEIAWEIALEGGAPLDLPELAALLFDDTSPRSLYVTHRMLRGDSLYFKPASSRGSSPHSYVARSPEDVATLRRQQEEAEAVRQEAEGWKAAVAAARAAKTRAQQPSAADWRAGPYARRIAAVKSVAISAERTDAPTLQLALSSLQLAGAGSRADAEAAAGLLMELGVFRRHEPLELVRRGVELHHNEERERLARELVASPPPDPDAHLRQDLTHLRVFTIDDASTTEVDDGLSLERLPSGLGIRIWIHVADPTRWIRPGSSLDLAGRERSRTLYLPWGSVPMFPRTLAEGPFSLRAGEVCDAMSVGVQLNPDGSLGRTRVVPSRVRVSNKVTYAAADTVLQPEPVATATTTHQQEQQQQQPPLGKEGAPEGRGVQERAAGPGVQMDSEAVENLRELQRMALLRRAYRESRGCIEIPLPEAKIHVPFDHLDRARPAVTIQRISQWESASRSLVAEMMILAGEAVGALGSEAALPLPYRGQDAPELPPTATLAALPEGPCRGFALKRCMTRSTVSSEPQRHASLALDAYVQFTSPIRRYSDLMAHFNVKAWLRGEPLPFSAAQIDAVADAAAEAGRELGAAERESEAYWVAEYLRLNWGAEYPAMVLGWQREDLKLAAFLLDDQGLEVVVRLPAGAAFSPGDRCLLAAKEANPAAGHFRFHLVGWTSGRGVGGEGEDDEELADELEAVEDIEPGAE